MPVASLFFARCYVGLFGELLKVLANAGHRPRWHVVLFEQANSKKRYDFRPNERPNREGHGYAADDTEGGDSTDDNEEHHHQL